ncbi:MAG: hypothetical protein WCG11_07370 [Methylococcaceae bacterium]
MPTHKYQWIKQQVKSASENLQMNTLFGGRRIVDWSVGEQLPRICRC